MSLKAILAFLALSTAGFTTAPLVGQVEPPRNFQAYRDGDDIVVRWWADGEADLYVGEVDQDPRFGSPSRWGVSGEGQRTVLHRLQDLTAGTYYVRVRAVETFLIIRRQSSWSHVERVVIGPFGRGDRWPDQADDGRWPDQNPDHWPRDGRDFPTADEFPRALDARVAGDDVRVVWSPVRGAERYLLQVDTERSFRDPYTFSVDAWSDRTTQDFVLRNVPRGRYYVRVRAVESFVSRDSFRWSDVEVFDVHVGQAPGLERQAELRTGRFGVLRGDGRSHPVFDEHPGRGKGHLKHEGKKHTPGQ